MNTKLTQKELVNLFNQEMARYQQAIIMAQLKYEEALVTFATENLGVTENGWQATVDDCMEDIVAQDFVKEMYVEALGELPNHYVAHEYTLRSVIQDMGGEDWEELNTTA